jgi:hypothetical protein
MKEIRVHMTRDGRAGMNGEVTNEML